MLSRRPMYFARTLLALVLLMGGLMEVASAQHKYIFPQFAFGGGWESTLMVQALGSNTTCTFSAQDRSFTMRDPSGNSFSGTQLPLVFGMNGWTILKTATPQGMTASSGIAVLDCDEEVSANTLFSLEVGGSLVAEAVVESSEEIVPGGPVAQFLADHRDGARFGVAVANSSNQPLGVLIAVDALDGQQIGEATVNVPANTAQAFFVDELVTIPAGHTGQVLIQPSNNPGPSVYVVGLRVTGLVITTIPATVRLTTPPIDPTFPNVAGTYTGPLDLTIAGLTVTLSARMTVVQSGAQLTITWSALFAGETVQLPAITGNINQTGFFTATSGFSSNIDDPNCGRITTTSSILTFSGNTARYVETATSSFCGNISISGTLTR